MFCGKTDNRLFPGCLNVTRAGLSMLAIVILLGCQLSGRAAAQQRAGTQQRPETLGTVIRFQPEPGVVEPSPSDVAPTIPPILSDTPEPSPMPGELMAPPDTTAEDEEAPDVADLGAGVGLASGPASALWSVGGYIDSAIVQGRVRFRFDAGYDNPVPDRAEFFYGEDGPGGLAAETAVDHQELFAYIEMPITRRLSGFVDVGVRFLNPEINPNASGLGDINAGVRYALWDCCGEYLTLQLKIYAPSGDSERGLGTGHVSIEPGVLFQKQASCRFTWFGEVKGWLPTSDSVDDDRPFSGEVIRYGLGGGYDLYQCMNCCTRQKTRLTAVVETVGWTILNGQGTFFDGVNPSQRLEVDGDTIVNIKLGGRYTSGRGSLYAGWGHSLTGDRWYRDILRVEYELRF